MPRTSALADLIRVLDSGGTVPIRASRTKPVVALAACFVLGLVLLALLVLILTRSIEEGTDWRLIVFNLRLWALLIAVVACLVGMPWAMVRRLRQSETLLLSRHGIAEHHGHAPTPRATVQWNEIRAIALERQPTGRRPNIGPRLVTYHLTPEAVRRRGRQGAHADVFVVWSMYEVSRQRLAEVLRAAHSRYARG